MGIQHFDKYKHTVTVYYTKLYLFIKQISKIGLIKLEHIYIKLSARFRTRTYDVNVININLILILILRRFFLV